MLGSRDLELGQLGAEPFGDALVGHDRIGGNGIVGDVQLLLCRAATRRLLVQHGSEHVDVELRDGRDRRQLGSSGTSGATLCCRKYRDICVLRLGNELGGGRCRRRRACGGS